MKKYDLKVRATGLSKEERKQIRALIRKINYKRKRSNMPRLRYKIKLG